ncbi:MAG: hypothetical protein IJP54_09060 [Synergistaceae bacterium]|nr:hypothetical protein [Synergistaceae bacterium]
MSYNSIIPDGFVPSRECVDWLQSEAMRLFDTHGDTLRECYKLKSPYAKDYMHFYTLGLFTELIHEAYKDAYQRWINQPAFDWMKEGEI